MYVDETQMADVQRALDEYSELTGGCVQFRPRTEDDEDYVYITSVFGGCFADVGRIGGPQVINYEIPGCTDRHEKKK